MSRHLAHAAASERSGDAVNTARRRWERWGHAWGLHTACHGCGEVTYCRGLRRRFVYCLACFAAGLVYVETGRRR